MVNIYLCDDSTILLNKYENILRKLAEANDIKISLKAFTSGEQLLFYLSDKPNEADIIYLDVLMGELNGIDVGKRLREIGCKSEIIFLTSNEAHVYDSFDINPLHYILKDHSSDKKFEEIFLRAVELTSGKSAEVFICEANNIVKKIPLKDIPYFEVHNRLVTVYYNATSFDFYSTMESIEQELCSKCFVRCHRSYLVNIKYIDAIDKVGIHLSVGISLPVGPTYIKAVKQALSDYLTDMF